MLYLYSLKSLSDLVHKWPLVLGARGQSTCFRLRAFKCKNISDKSTAIIVQLDPVKTTRKRYQKFVNKLMKEKGFGDYKSLVLDPLEDWSLAGVETRKMAPCVLINIGTRKDFGKASKYMKITKYYEWFLLEDFKRLQPKTYKKKIMMLQEKSE